MERKPVCHEGRIETKHRFDAGDDDLRQACGVSLPERVRRHRYGLECAHDGRYQPPVLQASLECASCRRAEFSKERDRFFEFVRVILAEAKVTGGQPIQIHARGSQNKSSRAGADQHHTRPLTGGRRRSCDAGKAFPNHQQVNLITGHG